MAAAAVSLACPLRRSTRLAHAHPHRRLDPDVDPDSSSDDHENELTPRALRALKRQRLALDPDGLPFHRPRPKKRRKDPQPLAPARTHGPHPSSDSCHGTHTARAPSPKPINDPALENRPPSPACDPSKPDLSIPLPPVSPDPSDSPSDSEPLTPLTPLTPSPESSPSLPGHDRPTVTPPPPQDPLPPPVPLDPIPVPEPQPPSNSFPPPPIPPSLDPALDTLIPFDGLHSQFDPDLQMPHPPTPPQLQALEPFHSFSQHQFYVPPNPVFVRDREINIWKLACQERVDCLLRRYGADYIKALVESQARSVTRSGTNTPPSQTKFRLYTPASYTYSLSSWGSTSATRKPSPVDEQGDDPDPAWPVDDADWADADIDMEDEDEDDYEDDDDATEGEAQREGETTLEAGEGVDPPEADSQAMDVDVPPSTTPSPETPVPPRLAPDPSIRPSTPIPHPPPPPPLLTPPSLPPLSSLHVPLLSEPPRAFMGRGTPPDRRRLNEWSGSGRFAANGMGPPLYLSPVPQRHANTDVPMSVDPPLHPPSPHTHGEWTSFLYSMLEGDGVGVGVGMGTNVVNAGHASEPTWYELGLASVPPVVPEPALELPTHARPSVEPVDEASNSSSTLRFALG